MNKNFDDYDTQIQCEEHYDQPELPTSLMAMMWLNIQSLQVNVYNN